MGQLIDASRELADEVLFPSALEVDRTGTIPDSHWERFAEVGFFGVAAPPEVGGPGAELPEIVESLEILAGACLATTFTWVQHHGPVMALASSANAPLRDELLADLMAGRRRAGVSFAAVIPDPPRVHAERFDGGWRLSGIAPFVSGWGIIDLLQVSGADVGTGDIISGLVPAAEQPGIAEVIPLHLVAGDASNTVAVRFDGLVVADDRVVSRVPRAEFLAGQIFPIRLNGSFALGIARRCAQLLDQTGFGDEADRIRTDVDTVRHRLDAGIADRSALIQARADASQLALRASAALIAGEGGRSLLTSDHAQLLARNALFTLVAASRDDLKACLLDRYSTTPA